MPAAKGGRGDARCSAAASVFEQRTSARVARVGRVRAWAAALIVGLTALVAPGHLHAQNDVRVRLPENFRKDPNGVVLARLTTGTALRSLGTQGNWTQVELEGWVWLQSLRSTTDEGFDLVVSESGGENLRAEPRGPIVARLEEGALLEELERGSAWARVRRTGWVWTASVDAAPGATAGPMIQPEAPAAEMQEPATPPGGIATVGAGGGSILTAPDGDTLAFASPGRDLEVVGRSGNWVRVRLEGWLWQPEGEAVPRPDSTPLALTPAELTADPQAHVGRVVAWTLQFISLERAEAVRTDFREGEPFLLARYGGEGGPFVYVPVPPERLPDVTGLVPLERIQVTARVRTGASALTGTPIVDLMRLERSREAP